MPDEDYSEPSSTSLTSPGCLPSPDQADPGPGDHDPCLPPTRPPRHSRSQSPSSSHQRSQSTSSSSTRGKLVRYVGREDSLTSENRSVTLNIKSFSERTSSNQCINKVLLKLSIYVRKFRGSAKCIPPWFNFTNFAVSGNIKWNPKTAQKPI